MRQTSCARVVRAGLLLPRDGHTVTLWNRDCGAMNTDTNLYGSHPLLIELRPDGSAHGIFVASSNGLEAHLQADRTTFRCAAPLPACAQPH